jgi:Holliday junction resolvase
MNAKSKLKVTPVSPPPAVSDALAPLIEDTNSRRTAYRRRRDDNDYLKVHPADEAKNAQDGWVRHKQTKTHVWLKRRKSVDRRLEDEVWCLFYRMGYPVLNGPRFRIRYKRADGTIGSKQVDVFAKDDETAVIVECKARETRGRRPLQKDIHETENLQKAFSQAIRTHFGNGYNPKIIWIYATSNIIWAEKDMERAEAANIRVVTENELQYFEAFVSHIGTAGRYQFLAEYLEGQQIPGMEGVKVPAVKGRFGQHVYYSFVASARHLLKIAFVNHQALNHPDGKPAYQRMINKKRISDIGTFIQQGGYFPTNLLVNFVEECRFDQISNKENSDKNTKFGWLYLPGKYKSAWVIDGQHRLYGFSNIDDKFLDRSLFVLAFEKMDAKTEADLFITINHEQRSVSKTPTSAPQAGAAEQSSVRTLLPPTAPSNSTPVRAPAPAPAPAVPSSAATEPDKMRSPVNGGISQERPVQDTSGPIKAKN